MTNIIFFGPPGAGKGTQAKKLSKHLEIPHLSTGDILRSKINQKDELAEELRIIMDSGKLVSDNILNKIVSDKLILECKNGFILDGYPRTLDQSSFLDQTMIQSSIKLNFIFNIYIDFNKLKERIINRSKEENRADDNINVVLTRYNAYNESTKLVSDYYKKTHPKIFYEINGFEEIDEITSKINKIVKNSWYSANICYFFTWLKPNI